MRFHRTRGRLLVATAVAVAAAITGTTAAAVAAPRDAAVPVLRDPNGSGWAFGATVKTNDSSVRIKSGFTAPAAGSYVLDTEVYSPDGRKVGQWFVSRWLDQNERVTFGRRWNDGSPGVTYTVKQGAFTESWRRTIAWSNNSARFTMPGGVADTSVPPTTGTSMKPPTTVTPTTAKPVPTTGTSMKPPTTVTPTTAKPVPTTGTSMKPPTTVTPTTVTPTTAKPGSDPLEGVKFYGPNADAATQANAWRNTRPSDAALMDRMANTPTATWYGDWTNDVRASVNTQVSAAAAKGSVAVLVAYNIPGRDCGSYSAGGAGSESAYNTWIDAFAAGIGNRKTVVVLEPDALAQMCGDTAARYRMLNHAVDALAKQSGAVTYIDAGHSAWISAAEMSTRLKSAGVAKTQGFAVNVSNFLTTSDEVVYGNDIAGRTGKHFIVDTSRNGRGGNTEWCNPSGRALGASPTTATASANADAYLWVKIVGQSDGECNGGPRAGTWWGDYALGLAKAAWG